MERQDFNNFFLLPFVIEKALIVYFIPHLTVPNFLRFMSGVSLGYGCGVIFFYLLKKTLILGKNLLKIK